MRHRLVCPLYDKHPKHLEVLNHLLNFTQSDRGRELATLVVAGYQTLYGRDPQAMPHSLQPDLGDILNQLAALQNRPATAPESAPAPAPIKDEPKKSSYDETQSGRLEETTNKNKESSEPKEPRVLTPPKTPMKPSEELLDEPLTNDSSQEEIVDPLASLGRMFS